MRNSSHYLAFFSIFLCYYIPNIIVNGRVMLQSYIKKILALGVTQSDSNTLKLKKISVTTLPLIIAPIGFIWGVIYLMMGNYISALIPLSYTFISALGLLHFYKTKDIVLTQTTQMYLTLLLPFFLMWSLGGFVQGSFVMVWAFFAPILAMILDKSSKSLYWFYAFLTLVLFSALMDKFFIQLSPNTLPIYIIELFSFLNITAVLSGIYFLIKHFINENEKNSEEKLNFKNEVLKKNTKELFDNLSFLQSYKDTIDKNLIVTRTNLKGEIIFANENFYAISGFTPEEVLGKNHNIIRHPSNKKSLFKKMWATISTKKTWHGRIQNMRKDGTGYWIDTTIAPIFNRDEEIVEYIAIRHDITKLIKHQDELTQMLYIDQLTSLENRNALIKELENKENYSLMLINIDRFSQINNLYGSNFGNEVLISLSSCLNNLLDKKICSKLYRLNGDEFVILFKDLNLEQVNKEVFRIQDLISEQALIVQDQNIFLHFSIGVSLEANEVLLSTANMALQVAKREAKNMIIYNNSHSLNKEYENNILWIKKIKSAIENDRIVLFYQEIVCAKERSMKKYESLIRLIDEEEKVVSPFFFLDIAKKAKLYPQLTKIVIRKSFEAFENNNNEVSINITIDDILNEDTKKFIYAHVENSSASNRVTFEIVESENIEDFSIVEDFITTVKSFGCKIAIDDFGTGYSNFEYLMRLQADFIKIDGSIIKNILHDKKSELITSVIVAFAKEMQIEVVGEFVESKEIYEKLKEMGVHKFQGYYFHQPSAQEQ